MASHRDSKEGEITVVLYPLYELTANGIKQSYNWAIDSNEFKKLPEHVKKYRLTLHTTVAQAMSITDGLVHIHDNADDCMYSKEKLITRADMWEKSDGMMYDRNNTMIRPAVYTLLIMGISSPPDALNSLFDGSVKLTAMIQDNIVKHQITGTFKQDSHSMHKDHEWDPCH